MRKIHIEIFANMQTRCVFLNNVEDYEDTYKPQYKFDVFDIVKLKKDEPAIGLQLTHEVNGKGILMMNVDTEAAKKLIVCEYPRHSGGNFLLSSLALSSDVLPDISLDAKMDHIREHFNTCRINDDWIDLNMNPLSEDRINNNEWTFTNTHEREIGVRSTLAYKKTYPNVRLMKIKNYGTFKFFRIFGKSLGLSFRKKSRMDLQEVYELLDYRNYSDDVITTAREIFHDIDSSNEDYDYTWDADNYLNINQYLNGIKILYEKLNLSGYNRDVLTWFYDEWVDLNDAIYFNTSSESLISPGVVL